MCTLLSNHNFSFHALYFIFELWQIITAFVLTSDKREPEKKNNAGIKHHNLTICNTETFHISPEFITVHLQLLLQCSGTTAQLTTSLVFVHVLVSLRFSILSSVKMWSAWIQKETKWWLNTQSMYCLKIQYSQNHRDLEGEQAMKTKQSLKQVHTRFDKPSQINVTLWSS